MSNSDKDRKKFISKKRRLLIQIIYIIAVVIWILLIYALQTYTHSSPVSYLILGIPIFVYAIGFLSVGKITKKVRKEMFKGDILAVALLFITALFNSISRDSHFTSHIMLVAAILVVLSLVDIWAGEKSLDLILVTKSIFQTAAITLLIYVLFVRFNTRVIFAGYGARDPRFDYNHSHHIKPSLHH